MERRARSDGVSIFSPVLGEVSQHGGGGVASFAVETPRGVKVPDVVRLSTERLDGMPLDDEASSVMPEVVIEVLSASDTVQQMQDRVALYLDGGAKEVWLCDVDGHLTFLDADGERDASTLVPAFPQLVSS